MGQELTDHTYPDTIKGTEGGVVLFFKEHCPHCKNMEKVLEKFTKMQTGVAIYHIDSEKNPGAMAAFGVQRVPCLLVVKQGNVAAKKAGLMNPKEMNAFYESV